MAVPVRVLHVFGRLDRGGAETMVMNLYREIDRTKVQFDFVVCTQDTGAYEEEIRQLGGRVFRVPRFGPASALAFCRAFEGLFTAHPELMIVHGHLRSTATLYLGIAKRHGRLTIAHSHSTSSGRGIAAAVKNVLQRGIRHKADYLLACSDSAGRWLFGAGAPARENYRVLPNAVDTKSFTYDNAIRQRVRRELNLTESFVVGHIGSFLPVKNHEFLLRVFEALHLRQDKARLLVVGDGPLRADIETRIRERGLSDSVILAGTRRDIPALLMAMDVFVLPSFWEGLPVTAIEAQATGVRCVFSDSITKEAAITALCTFLSLEAGVATWAETILSFQGDGARAGMAQAVKRAGYDIEDTAKKMQDFYLCLTGQ